MRWLRFFVDGFRDICCFAVDNCDYLSKKYEPLQCVKYLQQKFKFFLKMSMKLYENYMKIGMKLYGNWYEIIWKLV